MSRNNGETSGTHLDPLLMQSDSLSLITLDSDVLDHPSSNCHDQDVGVVDFDWTFFSAPIPPKAAPGPLFGRGDQASLDRVAMDVAKLLNSLALCPDIKVVEPSLPERIRKNWGAPGLAAFARPGNAGTFQTADEPEFKCLHGSGDGCPLRFRDQQMYMLGHNDITQHDKPISAANPFQYLQKHVATRCIVQQRLAVITAKCEKVEIPRAVSTVKIFGHRWRVEQLGYVCR